MYLKIEQATDVFFIFITSMSFYTFHWFIQMVRLKLENIKLFKDDTNRERIKVSILRVLNLIRLEAPQPFSHHQPFFCQNYFIFDLLRKCCWFSIQRRILKQYLWVHRHYNYLFGSKTGKLLFNQMLQYSFSKARFVFIKRYITNYWYAR